MAGPADLPQAHLRDDPGQALVGRALAGDAEARARLAEHARGQVYRWCCSLLRDRDRAEDATQEVILRMWQHVPHLQDPRAFPAWLYRITLNVCRRAYPSETPVDLVGDRVAADQLPAASAPADVTAARQELDGLLDRLPDADLDVLEMRFSSELSAREMSRTLRISEGAARARVHAVIKRLRDIIGAGGE